MARPKEVKAGNRSTSRGIAFLQKDLLEANISSKYIYDKKGSIRLIPQNFVE